MAEKNNSKTKAVKGVRKQKPDSNDPEQNPLLHVENKSNFNIDTGNLLQTPEALIFKDYERFDIRKEKDHFDTSKINEDTDIIIALRYYEYICVARFKFAYVIPLLESGLTIRETFDMIKHSLKNKLLINAPTFDNIYELDIVYTGYVRY